MKNVTIVLDEEVERWVRVWSAEHETSVSRLVGDLLDQRMQEELGYQAKMRHFLSREPGNLSRGSGLPARDELHDRDLLR